MPKKRQGAKSEAEEELLRKEKRDLDIKVGFDTQEFFQSFSGSFMQQNWEQQIAIAMKDGYIGKYPKGDSKAGEYLVQDFADFSVARGFILGIEWVLNDIKAKTNRGRRLETQRRREEKEQSET
jgi:hypothetical protein